MSWLRRTKEEKILKLSVKLVGMEKKLELYWRKGSRGRNIGSNEQIMNLEVKVARKKEELRLLKERK